MLHELLTGKRLFAGETISHTLANVLKAEINLAQIPHGPIRELTRRCLDRNLKNRLQHLGEARIAIENYLAHPQETGPSRAQTSHWPWAASALCLLAAVAATTFLSKPNQPAPLGKFDVSPPEGTRFAGPSGSAISPDGRSLAFVATNTKGESLLYVRALNSLEARALPGTEEAARPFWSPDGKSLAFGAQGKLKRIDLAGGSPLALCDTQRAREGTWNEDGVILFGDYRSGVQRIPASGGTPSPVTRLSEETGETAHFYPQFLPGGKDFLYLRRHGEAQKMGIFVSSLDGTPPIWLVQTGHKAVYDAAAGRLLYTKGMGHSWRDGWSWIRPG